MSSENKPREFCFIKIDAYPQKHIFSRPSSKGTIAWEEIRDAIIRVETKRENNPIEFHLIEYSAHQSALDEIAKRDETIAAFREALEFYCKTTNYVQCDMTGLFYYSAIDIDSGKIAKDILAKFPKGTNK